MGEIGVMPEMHPQVRSVTRVNRQTMPVSRSATSSSLSTAGAVVTLNDFVDVIQQHADVAVTLTVGRGEARRDVVVTPARRDGVEEDRSRVDPRGTNR